MSSFGGLSTAYTGLVAARKALEVTGQNVANANTEGYTRQRVDQSPMAQSVLATYFTQSSVGDGVVVTGVSRLNDAVVDARVNSTASSAAYWNASANAASAVETSLNEPGKNGLSQVMSDFWSSWQQMANNTGGSTAPAQALNLISQGNLVASTISAGYTAAAEAWTDARAAAASIVTTVNATAAKIADLNTSIRSLTAAGGNVNGLLDQRDAAVTQLAKLTGASTRGNADGSIDVIIGGNTLVSGSTTRQVALSGAGDFSAVASTPVKLAWDSPTGSAVSLDGGELAGRIAALQPADAGGSGTGGVYAEAAKAYDDAARSIADKVNAVHETGTTSAGTTGLDFFSYSATSPAALTLKVVPTSLAGIASADGTKGNLDNSVADRIAQLGAAADSPNAGWATYVSRVGGQSATAAARATTATTAATSATDAQTSVSGVDLDEETSNLVMYQHAYQASARVINTINDILDTLINMGAR
ncbi:flagellar hook-associated protein FlgK [Amnibacterium kyonggiense]|uniref:Flagellar hook-associated protein 1 n=1 Tax=Amnibacterium kyonggiense TaxID=595671 RepID=A0A4R7FQJ8_9MICO|nr:flagellar hook-associated protein FlgK [Amnibacterium kyonggiense]TDS80061.1 flagellar hook-associated protein 1 FlgK [Amnibacterium kyonggiense]